MYSWKVDRFTSIKDQNDHRPILHILLITFHRQKCWFFSDNLTRLIGVNIIFSCQGEPHTTATIWPHTLLPSCCGNVRDMCTRIVIYVINFGNLVRNTLFTGDNESRL